MPTTEQVRSTVRQYILEEFLQGERPESLRDSAPLISGGVLDSISTVRLVSFLEEQFGIAFAAHEISVDHLDTVDEITRTVESKLGRAL